VTDNTLCAFLGGTLQSADHFQVYIRGLGHSRRSFLLPGLQEWSLNERGSSSHRSTTLDCVEIPSRTEHRAPRHQARQCTHDNIGNRMSCCLDGLWRRQEDRKSPSTDEYPRRDRRIYCTVRPLWHGLGDTDKTYREIHGRSGPKQGYSKAVDMWAVGCVTVVLLTGALPFLDPNTKEYSQALADDCNLEILESSSEWSEVSAPPKDFVGKLLLDETQRLTAGLALQHQWFSNELHKTDFEELYKRTVRHWQPKVHKKPIIEFLNAREVKNLECSKKVLASERKTRGRGGQTPIEPPVCILCYLIFLIYNSIVQDYSDQLCSTNLSLDRCMCRCFHNVEKMEHCTECLKKSRMQFENIGRLQARLMISPNQALLFRRDQRYTCNRGGQPPKLFNGLRYLGRVPAATSPGTVSTAKKVY
jgi:hypothetical protein